MRDDLAREVVQQAFDDMCKFIKSTYDKAGLHNQFTKEFAKKISDVQAAIDTIPRQDQFAIRLMFNRDQLADPDIRQLVEELSELAAGVKAGNREMYGK